MASARVEEYERIGPLSKIAATLRELLLGIVTLGLTLSEFDPKRECRVIVFRRDDGSSVLVYTYSRLGEATEHATSLQSRLEAEHVCEFCRSLGIPMYSVQGPGNEEFLSLVWKEV